MQYILYFNEIGKKDISYVGGKGANLGEMTKAGFPVPQGFCVTTLAYSEFIQNSMEMNNFLNLLDQISPDDLGEISILGQKIREHLKSLTMPEDVKLSILQAWKITGKDKAYAVRSSATAEDLPTASFAGQQDTYLNIIGQESLLQAVQDCWASLFTDRAISYRVKKGFDHRLVFLSVVVQQMVFPEVSGIMFTADPITGRRKTISIDASFGLGEALVSGIVTADLYQVRSGKITKKQISKKKVAIYSAPNGGTIINDISSEMQGVQALPDKKIIELAELGQKIEDYYFSEQDIEWSLVDGKIYILQSRPITSLYPLPQVSDKNLHVFASIGHPQMMTDAIRPLGISLLAIFLGVGNSNSKKGITYEAGGRLYADLTGLLSMKITRKRLPKSLMMADELMANAISEVIQRSDFKFSPPKKRNMIRTIGKGFKFVLPIFGKFINILFFKDPAKGRVDVNSFMEKNMKECEKNILRSSGVDRIQHIKTSIGNMIPTVLPNVVVYPAVGIFASGKIERILKRKLGDKQGANLFYQLNKSLPGNVTTELGLAIGDLADTARKYPEVVEYIQQADNETFYEGLRKANGGQIFLQDLEQFMEKYGMRCSGEIDITNPRWTEAPMQLMPSIISYIRSGEPGEHREKFRKGEEEAEHAEKQILSHFGFFKRRSMSRLIKAFRNNLGMRENHKFYFVQNYGIFKKALLGEGHILVSNGIIKQEQDIFYLYLDELQMLIQGDLSGNVQELIEFRKKQHEQNQKLTPPRVMTSEGEIITGKRQDIQAPEGALIGTPVSAGIVEGVARVILRLEDAKLNPGEILVAPFTDPGWTPLFNSAKGLITEVGGMMTHGSVVAREYGIPAVVGIEKATVLIKDGAHIRLNGTEGYVEILN